MLRLVPIFFSTVFISLNYGALMYVNSTYLGTYFQPLAVTILFFLGYILNIGLFFLTPALLARFSKERILFSFILITLGATYWLSIATDPFAIATAFVIYQGLMVMLYWCLDIFLEEKSENQYTGEVRGIYYTFVNAGIAAGPLIVTLLASIGDHRPLYKIAALILLLPLAMSWRGLKSQPHWHAKLGPSKVSLSFRAWWRKRNIRAVTLARLILEIFYGVMVVYTPLYLHGVLGFEWGDLGIIFTVALLPFVFLEWPAGELADRLIGEKELMSIGFFITGTALLVMPFLGKNFLSWIMILFISRIGAALIEIMTETYFFKKISAEDTGILSIFRLVRPTGLMLGAALGCVVLYSFSFPAIFFALGIIILFGLKESLYLKDTL